MKYVILDCETGGFDSSEHSLLSVAMIKATASFQELDSMYVKIKHPTLHVTPSSLEHNGLDIRESNSWVDPDTARKQMLEFLDAPADVATATHYKPTYIGTGTNVLFDLPFLKAFLGERTVNNLFFHRVEEITSTFRDFQKIGIVEAPKGYQLWQVLEVLGIHIDSTLAYSAQENAEFALQAAREMHLRTRVMQDSLTAFVKRHGGDLRKILSAYKSTDKKTKLKRLRS